MRVKYNYELIKDYLNGLVDRDTAWELRNLIENDEIAREMAKGILIMKKEFDQDDERAEAYLDNLLVEQQHTIEKSSDKSKFGWWRYAAAILLLVVGGYAIYEFMQPGVDELLSTEMTDYYQAPIIFRSEDVGDAGLQAYNRSDFEDAIRLLAQNPDKNTRFFLGLSYLYTGKYDKAIEALNKDSISGRYSEHVTWYLMAAYLSNGDKKEGYALLKQIKDQPGHFKHEKALELFEAMK